MSESNAHREPWLAAGYLLETAAVVLAIWFFGPLVLLVLARVLDLDLLIVGALVASTLAFVTCAYVWRRASAADAFARGQGPRPGGPSR